MIVFKNGIINNTIFNLYHLYLYKLKYSFKIKIFNFKIGYKINILNNIK